MDAFFAAVEERDNPALLGLPIAVGSDPREGRGRGVVSTANYPARAYGIRSATPISIAWRLSEEARRRGKPGVVFLPVDFRKYGKASAAVMEILKRDSSLVEEASIDEAYFDLSFAGAFEKAREVCLKIKREIREKERLTASIGIGPNKLIAKIASDFKKPDGLTVVEEAEAEAFLENLPIRKIPGIGPKTEELFLKRGVKLVRDLKKFSREELRAMIGKWGLDLYEKARGRDDSELVEEYEAKSIGEQTTFFSDTLDSGFLFDELKKLCAGVCERFISSGFKTYKTISIIVRFADFETHTRAHTLRAPASDLKTVEIEAMKLLMPFLDRRENPRHKKIRLLGVRLEKLER